MHCLLCHALYLLFVMSDTYPTLFVTRDNANWFANKKKGDVLISVGAQLSRLVAMR